MSFRAEVLDADLEPMDVLERVRWSLRTRAGYDALKALGLAISEFLPASDLGGQSVGGRELLVAVMDVRFGWALNASAFDDDGGTIETVDGGTQAPGTAPTIIGTPEPWPGAGGSTFSDSVLQITIPIGTASSATSIATIPAGSEVVDTQVIVTTPYSPGTTILVGNSVFASLLQDGAATPPDNDPQVASTYDKVQQTSWGTSPLPVTVSIGGAPGSGAGSVVVQYLTPIS
jgi:hypothetical protein